MHSLDRARLIARTVAFELSRQYSERDWKRQFVKELESRQVDVFFDVGVNSGQYATGLRRAGYKGRIVSFEPLSEPFSVQQSKASTDSLWDCQRYALGDVDGIISINVAGHAGESSSVLPMLKSRQSALPSANYIGTEDVPIHRLDSVAPKILRSTDVSFLKIDVQGFENQVLAASKSTVNDRGRLLFEQNICHQSIFYRRELFAGIGPYNLRYPVWADWDFNIRCFSNPALVTRYMHIVVARYSDITGFSARTGDGQGVQKAAATLLLGVALETIRRVLAFLRREENLRLMFCQSMIRHRAASSISATSRSPIRVANRVASGIRCKSGG